MGKPATGNTRHHGKLLAAGVIALALAGCGGGGNGGIRATPQSPPPPPPPPPPPSAQPPWDAQLSLTNTYPAHAAGLTGAGVTIGVIDSGIMHDNPALAGRVLAELIYVDPSQNDTSTDDVVGHGTWVSEIAAGAEFQDFPGGIAPGANLVSARIISDNAPSDHGQPPSIVTADDARFFGAVNSDLMQYGVMVTNNSWGGITWDTSDSAVNQAFHDAYAPYINQGGLVVFAAGNGSDANPSTIAALPAVAPDLEKGWLTVVAVDSNHPDQLASYSNQCGVAMDYCLAAPGDVIVLDKDATAASTSPDYYIVSGTSLAAPQVTGAAALVWQAFPYFTNDLVRQTLLGTADDLGDPGPDPVFGYGSLNVGRAVQGPARFDWGDVAVAFDDLTSTWGNDIGGDGGLVKDGSGTLILAGNDSYTGGTQVLGGTLQAANPLPGDVQVGQAGTLDAVPGVQGNLDNAGTVVVAGGDTQVGGNFSQGADGTLSVSLGSLLDVDGQAQLAGTLNVQGADAGYVVDDHQDVLTAGGGLAGTFDAFTTSPGVFLASTLQYTSDSVWLDTTSLDITQAAQAMQLTDRASQAAALRVQRGFEAINSGLAGGRAPAPGVLAGAAAIQRAANPQAAHATLQSLSGQLHAASAAMLFDSLDASGRAISAHFDDLLDGRARPGTWYGNLGWQGNLQPPGEAGASFRSGGGMLGSEFVLGTHGLLGFAAGASRGWGQLDDAWDHTRTRTDHVMAYGGLVDGPWYASARVGGGWYRQDMQRLLWLGALAAPVGSGSGGRFLDGALEGGVQLHAGAARFTPFAELRYQRLEQGAFSEAGGYGFGLQARARTAGRLQAGVGLRSQAAWMLADGMWLQLHGSVAWRHSLHQFGDVFDASFTGFDEWLPLGGVGLARNESVLRAGVSLWPAHNVMLRLGFEQQRGRQQHAGSVGLQGSVAF